MSSFCPQTSKTDGYPNILFIVGKPEILGIEFENSVCPVLGVMMFLELKRGENGMNGHKYFKELGAIASATAPLAEGTTHKDVDQVPEVKVGDFSFGSVKSAVALAQHGFECILQVKQNHCFYPKNVITDIAFWATRSTPLYPIEFHYWVLTNYFIKLTLTFSLVGDFEF